MGQTTDVFYKSVTNDNEVRANRIFGMVIKPIVDTFDEQYATDCGIAYEYRIRQCEFTYKLKVDELISREVLANLGFDYFKELREKVFAITNSYLKEKYSTFSKFGIEHFEDETSLMITLKKSGEDYMDALLNFKETFAK